MLTKAIIQTVDYSTNRCVVRIPLFESSASSDPIIAEALISTAPGLVNSYFAGDIVFIGFEENKINKPVILGKLFRQTDLSSKFTRGNVACGSLSVAETAELPFTTSFMLPKADNSAVNTEKYAEVSTVKKLLDRVLTMSSQASNILPRVTTFTTTCKKYTSGNFTTEAAPAVSIQLETAKVYSSASAIPQLLAQLKDSYVSPLSQELLTKVLSNDVLTSDETTTVNSLIPIPVMVLSGTIFSSGTLIPIIATADNNRPNKFVLHTTGGSYWFDDTMPTAIVSQQREY